MQVPIIVLALLFNKKLDNLQSISKLLSESISYNKQIVYFYFFIRYLFDIYNHCHLIQILFFKISKYFRKLFCSFEF